MKRWRWLITFPIALVSAYAVMDGEPSRSLNEAIYRWQTLIAGLLATAAAYATVNKMTEVDRKAEERHLDLVAVQLNRDRIALAVAEAAIKEVIVEYARNAVAAAHRLDAVYQDAKPANYVNQSQSREIADLLNTINRSGGRVHDYVASGGFDGARDLMPPAVLLASALLQPRAERLKNFHLILQPDLSIPNDQAIRAPIAINAERVKILTSHAKEFYTASLELSEAVAGILQRYPELKPR